MKNVDELYPLTPTQAGVLYHCLREADPSLYFEQVRTAITGDLDVERLKLAWARVTQRHPAMRAIFVWEGMPDPLQVVRSDAELAWRDLDLRHLRGPDASHALEQMCRDERAAGVDLRRAPISRFVLVRLTDDLWHLVWNFHHILLDGWSAVSVFNEAFEIYDDPSLSRGPGRKFSDHLTWLAAQDSSGSEQYWRAVLDSFEAPAPLDLGSGSDKPGFDPGEVVHSIDVSASAALRDFARSRRVTLNTVIQAGWAAVLSRYLGEHDVVFGVTISGRPADLDGVEDVVGMFLNTLPMRLDLARDIAVEDWLLEVQNSQLDINTHQHSALADIVRWTDLAPGAELFESILVFENYPMGPGTGIDGISVERLAVHEQSHYPLTVMVRPSDEVSFVVLYDRSRFSPEMVRQMFRHLECALANIVENPEGSLLDLKIMSPDELVVLLEESSDTSVSVDDPTTLDRLFRDQVAGSPESTALVFGDSTMSYRTLDEKSESLAVRLVASGVTPGTPVGVAMYRCFDQLVALLATLKVGAAYVSLDPSYPEARMSIVAEDAGVKVILTNRDAAGSVAYPDAAILEIDGADADSGSSHAAEDFWGPAEPNRSDAIAFVAFTSGSTGRPKGVAISHDGILNRLRWQWDTYPLADDEVCVHKTTLNFVDHLWEIWGPLLAGKTLVLVPEDTVVDTGAMLDLLATHDIQRMSLVPSYMRAMLEGHDDLSERVPALRYWTLSGETTTLSLAMQFRSALPDAVLLNFYGMSEATQDVSYYDDRWDVESRSVPVGRPIHNTSIHVLDRHGRLAPFGVTGQIHVSGAGLAAGYWHRDDLTAERFRPNPFGAGKLYSTGDLGRWLPGGHLDHVGRADGQVKVRGSRVELGDVEQNIVTNDLVSECVVVVVDAAADDTRLSAYVVLSQPCIDVADAKADILDHARGRLPGYMVPSAVFVLDEFPLTPSGKLDRSALPEIRHVASRELDTGEVGSVTELRMVELWSETLGQRVGLDDDFFDAGGHSLLALRLVTRVAGEFDKELPLAAFFAARTPRRLTAYLEGDQQRDWAHMVPISAGVNGRPNIFVVHGAGGNVMNLHAIGRHLDGDWSLVGLQASGVDGVSPLHADVTEFCDAYLAEIREYQPQGPYVLAGYSAGGVIAYEMGRRLEAMGHEVAAVYLIDTFHPGLPPSRLPTLRRCFSVALAGPAVIKVRLGESARKRKVRRRHAEPLQSVPTQNLVPLDVRAARLRANMTQAVDAFDPPRHGGKVILFGAQRISWEFERVGKLRGWEGVATDLEFHEIPGRHRDIVLDPNAGALAAVVAARTAALTTPGESQ